MTKEQIKNSSVWMEDDDFTISKYHDCWIYEAVLAWVEKSSSRFYAL
jgi:hypothetical protein